VTSQQKHQKLIKTADYSARQMTAKFRSYAYKNGWPTEITRKLKVEHDGGDNFFIQPSDDIEDAVLNLEQGNLDNPPNAAILRFMNRLHPHVDDYVNLIFTEIMDMEIFK
jgi:hypothetical protein